MSGAYELGRSVQEHLAEPNGPSPLKEYETAISRPP